MARFRGLLRISELEDHQRRSGFLQLDPLPLLQELYDFTALAKGQVTEAQALSTLPLRRACWPRSPGQPAEQFDRVHHPAGW